MSCETDASTEALLLGVNITGGTVGCGGLARCISGTCGLVAPTAKYVLCVSGWMSIACGLICCGEKELPLGSGGTWVIGTWNGALPHDSGSTCGTGALNGAVALTGSLLYIRTFGLDVGC